MSLFDQSQRYLVAQAKENVRGAEIDATKQQEEVAYRVAVLYLDAEVLQRSVEAANREVENLKRVAELVKTLVDEGRNLHIDASTADMNLHHAAHHGELLRLDLTQAEASLAAVLGLKADDLVQPPAEERSPFALPESEQATIDRVLESSPLLKHIESSVQSKELEIKSYRAQHLPKFTLIAQDEIYAPYYVQNYYPNFHYNSLQVGAGVSVPVIAGGAAKAYIGLAEAEIAKLRIEADRTRNRLASDIRRAFQEVNRAEVNRADAREELDLAREQVSLDLARLDEGRVPPSTVEQARALEQEKWIAYYAAQHAVEVARLSVLRDSGTLVATVH
jgi:outer membrane protein